MPKYTVVESRQMQTLGPTGNSVSQYRVWIKTERGSTGSIDVVLADWDKTKLQAILGEFAEQLDLAFNLEA